MLDTNVALSVLVFTGGTVGALRRAWQSRRFTPLLSTPTADELIRILAYPKFRLGDDAREALLADYVPYCESVRIPDPPPSTPRCRDPYDTAFLELALAGRARWLVSGDDDLLSLASDFPCPIVTPAELLETLEGA